MVRDLPARRCSHPEPMHLRIATFNIESFGGDGPASVPLDERIRALRPKLERLGADVLCLQEVNAERPDQRPRAFHALGALLEGTAYADYERVATHHDGGGPFDVHNLVVLSRFPVRAQAQHRNDAVRPLRSQLVHGAAPADDLLIGWDRPVLEVCLELPDGRLLTVLDAHLRAPLASAIPGQKLGPFAWRSTQGWAEGYFVAAVKRAGQALELRLRVDRILDDDPDALVVVAGDLNADPHESATRILRASDDDTGNAALGRRSLTSLLDGIEPARRFTSRYQGRASLPDQLLATAPLARGLVSAAILNEDLEDAWELQLEARDVPGSLHAPAVAEVDV
jgi:endonuclease/exonuclease/phosphatase family metal-dependent hydrolase